MLELTASAEHKGDARLPIRWCVGRDALDELKRQGVLFPHLFILVTQNNGDHHHEVARKLVPLDQIIEYLDFHRSGEHHVQATIVWHEKGDIRALKATMLGGYYNSYEHHPVEALDSEGNLWFKATALDNVRHVERCAIDVDVDAKFFAKEPSQLEKWWVNLWFGRSRAKDQCHFRRRRIVAYSLQPPLVALYLVVLLGIRLIVALSLLSVCKRGINWSPIFHPWEMGTGDVWFDTDGAGTFFTRKKDGKATGPRTLFVPFSPIVFLGVSAVLLLIQRFVQDQGLTISRVALIAVIVQAALTAFLLVLALGSLFFIEILPDVARSALDRVVNFFGDFFDRHPVSKTIADKVILSILLVLVVTYLFWMLFVEGGAAAVAIIVVLASVALIALLFAIENAMSKAKKKRAEAVFSETDDVRLGREALEVYDALACREGALLVNLRALPKSRRTFYLRFQDLKSKVCRPFGH